MDTAVRYGGEELAILMPRTDLETADNVVERIRTDIEQLSIDAISVTVSIGIAASNHTHTSPANLIHAADQVLYKAKPYGKNRVVRATPL